MADQVQTQWDAERILKFLEDHRDELRAMGVRKLGLFGSVARGEHTPNSDVDVLLSLDQWTWNKWCRVWDFLEDNLGVKVDLVPEEDLRPELRQSVFSEARYAQID